MQREGTRGPHSWVNWQALIQGQPRRQARHPDNFSVTPIWQEFALYTDAGLGGAWLAMGGFEAFPLIQGVPSRVGFLQRSLILRVWDHLEDEPYQSPDRARTDVADFTGGNIGDELAALLGLALGIRLRSGGLVRMGLPEHKEAPLGIPDESRHRRPFLEPPHRAAMIDGLGDPADLGDAGPLLAAYPRLASRDAVALVRAARQYVDGLWLADADPRLAWIKLVGALEAAAVRHDAAAYPSAAEQLEAAAPSLHAKLVENPEMLVAVAEETARLFRVMAKVRGFVADFAPDPPPERPTEPAWSVNWGDLERLVGKVYAHRSADLHEGLAFPPSLCRPPERSEEWGTAERPPWSSMTALGAEWTAEEHPMHLHLFAYVVGETLRAWWRSFAAGDPRELAQS